MKSWKGKIFYYSTLLKKHAAHRYMVITSNLLNKKIKIYNGKIFRLLYIRKKFLFNKFGSLFFTKKKSLYLKAKIKKKKNKIKRIK